MFSVGSLVNTNNGQNKKPRDMKNSKRTLTTIVALLTVSIFISCTSPTIEDSNQQEIAPLTLQPEAEPTLPTCSTRKLSTWLVGTSNDPLGGYTSEVVCPPSSGGDGYLSVSSQGIAIDAASGYQFGVDKWDDTAGSWEINYWTSSWFWSGESIYVYESDAYGNAFNGMDGDDRFRFKVYQAIPTGGGSGSEVDSIRVVFDLND